MPHESSHVASDRIAGTLVFIAAAALYGLCLPSAPANWDIAELQTATYILGIPHPTGFPAFILSGYIFSHVLLLSTAAWRINLFCALWSAVSCVCVFRIARGFGASLAAAFLGAVVFALNVAVWDHAIRTEVHDMVVALTLLCLAYLQIALRQQSIKALTVASLFCGFALATHPIAIWVLPALALAAVFLRKRFSLKTGALAFAALFIPLALYGYLPLRSAFIVSANEDPVSQPPLNGNVPSLIWNTNRPSTAEGFKAEVFGTQFGAHNAVSGAFDVRRYAFYAQTWWRLAAESISIVVFALAAFALCAHLFEKRRNLLPVLLGGFGAVPFAAAYAEIEGDVVRYLLVSFAVLIALAASTRVNRFGSAGRVAVAAATCAVFFIVAAGEYQRSAGQFGARTSRGGEPIIELAERTVPPGSIVVADWVDATALAYGAFVDNRLSGRILVSGWPGEFVAQFPEWTCSKRLFLVVNGSVAGNLRAVPHAWLRRKTGGDAWNQIYEVTAACRR